ncbi:MAG TPA: Ku protein [Solirubrobacteraceae bacterium]|nr:Ku protein [Solirubrobacteraceae bacterium]
MPRSIWNGTVMLGRIPVAVKVYSATEDHTIHFHQVHAADGERIKQRRVCAKEGREVPYKQIVKGYERSNGSYVVLSQDEIAAAAGDRAHVIELEQFVVTAEVDPVFFDRTYYLGARDKDARGPYRLLHDALAKTERAGLGRWVFHNREYLVAVRALDDVVALHTMRFADELVDAEKLELPRAKRAPGKREVEMAGRLVDSLQARFDPDGFSDSYRERVRQLIEAKARGETPDIEPEQPRGQEDADLMGALEASLAGSGR